MMQRAFIIEFWRIFSKLAFYNSVVRKQQCFFIPAESAAMTIHQNAKLGNIKSFPLSAFSLL
jgi:hypothetical protein